MSPRRRRTRRRPLSATLQPSATATRHCGRGHRYQPTPRVAPPSVSESAPDVDRGRDPARRGPAGCRVPRWRDPDASRARPMTIRMASIARAVATSRDRRTVRASDEVRRLRHRHLLDCHRRPILRCLRLTPASARRGPRSAEPARDRVAGEFEGQHLCGRLGARRWHDPAMRIALADDADLLREALASALTSAGFEVVGQAGDAEGLLRIVDAQRPTSSSSTSGCRRPTRPRASRRRAQIRASAPGMAILVLSQYVETRYAVDLLRDDPSGVGYLLKDRVDEGRGPGRGRAARGGGRLRDRPGGRRPAARQAARPTPHSTS